MTYLQTITEMKALKAVLNRQLQGHSPLTAIITTEVLENREPIAVCGNSYIYLV